jgi:hypothetical protein
VRDTQVADFSSEKKCIIAALRVSIKAPNMSRHIRFASATSSGLSQPAAGVFPSSQFVDWASFEILLLMTPQS